MCGNPFKTPSAPSYTPPPALTPPKPATRADASVQKGKNNSRKTFAYGDRATTLAGSSNFLASYGFGAGGQKLGAGS